MKLSKNKVERCLPHFVGLLLFLLLPLFIFDKDNERSTYWMYSYYYQLLFMLIAFYVNYLFIVPYFFFSKKRIYFFIVLLLFAFFLLIIWQQLYDILPFDNLRPNGRGRGLRLRNRLGLHPKLLDNFFLLVLVLGFSSGMAIIQRLRKNEAKQEAIEKARVDSELAFLKNQISPHFFFNALNTIYGLIAIDSHKAQEAVEKLSVLMRYLIYDSDTENIDLQKEFDFTLKYIELMQQRLSSKVRLDIEVSSNIPKGQIPPLLFIPFVENAFKHGISYREDSFVSVLLQTQNDYVVFECTNSIPAKHEQKEKKGGLGIANIKKRLDLLYGNSFSLAINNAANEYHVQLIVPFKKDSDE